MRSPALRSSFHLFLLAAATAGCGIPDDGVGPPGTAPKDGVFAGSDYSWGTDGTTKREPAGSRPPGGTGGVAPGSPAPSAPGASSGAPGGDRSGAPCPPSVCTPGGPPPVAGQLTAGEWSDLMNWDFMRKLLVDEQGPNGGWGRMRKLWGIDPLGRVAVKVKNGEEPALNVSLVLVDGAGKVVWRAISDTEGRAELFAGLFQPTSGPYQIRIAGSQQAAVSLPTLPAEPVVIQMGEVPVPARAIDLMFMVDTTGSMGDELSYIKSELANVVERVKATTAELDLRLSVNFYRDLEDEYIVRGFPFSHDVSNSVTAIGQQQAGGGGDTPEAVDRALQVAIEEHEWSPVATTRLLVLVLDAPPHPEAPVLERVRAMCAAAAAKGIRIIPVGASGIDKETEFLLRFLAVATGGTYSFLTDHSGIGNPHLDPSPTIGDFKVERLNDLLVRVISERL